MRRLRWTDRLWAPVLVLALLPLFSFAFGVLRADPQFFAAQRAMVFWGNENFRPDLAEVNRFQQQMEQALSLWPDHPDYLALQARLLVWQALLGTDLASANARMQQALALMEQSLRVRPGSPYSWAQYAEYLATQPVRRTEFLAAVNKARQLGPGDPDLQLRLQNLLAR